MTEELFEKIKEEWMDTEPIPSTQSDDDAIKVLYSDEYIYIMGIFRAALNKMEISQRALDLTTYIISNNPSNITVWWYRQEILKQIGYKWEEEMDFVDEQLLGSPKPYQIWNHRRFLDDRCETMPDEEKRLFRIIAFDQKNFHAYQFWCWFAQRWNTYEYFLKFTNDIIKTETTNNSALNFRMWLVETFKLDVREEFEYIKSVFARDYQNESIANYIRGLLKLDPSLLPEVKEYVNSLEDYHFKEIYSLLYTIATLENDKEAQEKWCDKLIELDPHKSNYWKMIKSNPTKYQ